MPLRSRLRRGVALPDLLLGLVLFGLVGTVFCRCLLLQSRTTRALLERAATSLTLDQAGAFLASELEALGRSGPDLLRSAAESLSYRGFRGAGLACGFDSHRVLVLAARLSGARSPQAGRDSLLLFVARDDAADSSAAWVALPITSVRPGTCPGGAAAVELGTLLDTARIPPADLPPLVPLALFEVMQTRLYQSQGRWWLGARSESGGEAIQPLAGPFAPGGVALRYTDSLGTATLQPGLTRAIRVDLHAGTSPGDSATLHLRPWNLR